MTPLGYMIVTVALVAPTRYGATGLTRTEVAVRPLLVATTNNSGNVAAEQVPAFARAETDWHSAGQGATTTCALHATAVEGEPDAGVTSTLVVPGE